MKFKYLIFVTFEKIPTMHFFDTSCIIILQFETADYDCKILSAVLSMPVWPHNQFVNSYNGCIVATPLASYLRDGCLIFRTSSQLIIIGGNKFVCKSGSSSNAKAPEALRTSFFFDVSLLLHNTV